MISSDIHIPGQSPTPDRSVQAAADTDKTSPFTAVINGLNSKPEAHTEQSPPQQATPAKDADQPADQPEELAANTAHTEPPTAAPDAAARSLSATGQQAIQPTAQLPGPTGGIAERNPAAADRAAAHSRGGKVLPMGGKNAPVDSPVARDPGIFTDTIAETSGRATTQVKQDGMAVASLPELDAGHRVGLSPADRLTARDGLVQPGGAMTPSETAATGKTESAVRGGESQASMRSAAGEAGWGEELRNRINWFNRNGVQRAELRLHPAELGSLEIRITTDNDQASIVFYSQNRAARELMEAEMPRLRELFAETGIELSQSDVSEQSLAQQKTDSQDSTGGRGTAESGAPEELSTATNFSPDGAEPGEHSGLIDYYI